MATRYPGSTCVQGLKREGQTPVRMTVEDLWSAGGAGGGGCSGSSTVELGVAGRRSTGCMPELSDTTGEEGGN